MYKNMRKKAEAGIGTLILFIALILVAAVAAGVLISTASSLQSKALFTGSKAQTQVSSQAVPIYMYATDASSGATRSINVSYLKVKLAPGSDAIKLSEALLQVNTKNSKATLTYSSSVTCTSDHANATVASSLLNDSHYNIHYGARYLAGTNNGYIERSSVVELCYYLPENVQEGQDLRVSFVPKIGSPLLIETKAPDVMLTQRVQLFP